MERIDEALDRLDAEIWRVLAGPKRGFNGPEGGWPYETGIMVVDCKPRVQASLPRAVVLGILKAGDSGTVARWSQ
jgi:hypothetical protein